MFTGAVSFYVVLDHSHHSIPRLIHAVARSSRVRTFHITLRITVRITVRITLRVTLHITLPIHSARHTPHYALHSISHHTPPHRSSGAPLEFNATLARKIVASILRSSASNMWTHRSNQARVFSGARIFRPHEQLDRVRRAMRFGSCPSPHPLLIHDSGSVVQFRRSH